MTPAELMTELRDLAAEVGPKAEAYVHIGGGSPQVCAVLNPDGILGKVRLYVHGEEWADLVQALRVKWEEHRDLHAANIVKSMAIAIIRLTAENGECTDAALRVEFSPQEVERYGTQAETLATEMGANGPFTIVKLASANYFEGEAA